MTNTHFKEMPTTLCSSCNKELAKQKSEVEWKDEMAHVFITDATGYTLRKKKYFRAPFLVLQLVTNRGLVPVSGRTN